MRLVQMPSTSTGETCAQVLARALLEAQNGAFDEIVILAQRSGPEGGVSWFARDNSHVATTMFLLQTAIFHVNCMIAGIKL